MGAGSSDRPMAKARLGELVRSMSSRSLQPRYLAVSRKVATALSKTVGTTLAPASSRVCLPDLARGMSMARKRSMTMRSCELMQWS